jgi:hypothetical protein
LKTGRTLVTVHLRPGQDDSPVVAAFEESGAYDVRVYEAPVETRGLRTVTVVTPPADELTSSDYANVSMAADGESLARVTAEQNVGDVSAHTDALGSGAEGGLGTGAPLGEEPIPLEPGMESTNAAHAPETAPEPAGTAEAEEDSGSGAGGVTG